MCRWNVEDDDNEEEMEDDDEESEGDENSGEDGDDERSDDEGESVCDENGSDEQSDCSSEESDDESGSDSEDESDEETDDDDIKYQILKYIPKLKRGDMVRILNRKPVINKGDVFTWSDEVYRVIHVRNEIPPTFQLEEKSEILNNQFREEQLLQVLRYTSPQIKCILKIREKFGLTEYKIRFQKKINKPDSWVNLIR